MTPAEAHRQQLLRSEERFRLLVESVKDYAIFMLDETGHGQTWNEGARRIKGYEAAEIMGSHMSRFYTPEAAAAGRPQYLLGEALRNGRVEDEGWRVRKDGTRFWADVVLTAIHDEGGSLIGFAKVTRDLTERKRSEDDRVRLAQAQEAVRLRDEFLSIASHELKTPLTALQLQLQGLVQLAESSDSRLIPRLTRALRSGERLTALIETLLDVARISTGRFNLNRSLVDLVATTKDVIERMEEQAAYADSTVRVHAPDNVFGNWDPVRVEQIISNLVGNALKYAAGTPVEVILRKADHEAVLEVVDGGPGIGEGDPERLFERFERASSSRHYGGLGLGLYVTRQIVLAHGGTVTAENRADGPGARFIVRLPVIPLAR